MTLGEGTRLGPYEIVAPLGAGGMGEVYEARDTRLDRTVAVKILPDHVANDPELSARFEREARAVAALNHPHICTLYDIGTSIPLVPGTDAGTTLADAGAGQPTRYLVLEYLDGETLAARLARGPLPLDQAVHCGIEIADALDKAHRTGIVHRDLKPGNIMMTESGTKLLDFGLAKLRPRSDVGDVAPTVRVAESSEGPRTARGVIVGTLQYMAPEQVEGREIDARTDVFALGATLYEMTTGQRPFAGESQASLSGAILHVEPPSISSLRARVPPPLEHVVNQCLAKDPDRRWQSASDIGLELEWIATRRADATATTVADERPLWRRALPATAAALGAAVAIGLAVWFGTRPAPRTPTRFAITLPSNVLISEVNVSADGTRLLYNLDNQLRVRALDRLDPRPIAGTEGALATFLSPDGDWAAFCTSGALKKISLRGGAAPVTLADVGCSKGDWVTDGRIVFATAEPGGLFQISSDGGAALPVTALEEGEFDHQLPQVLPGGDAVMFGVLPTGASWDEARVVIQSLDTGDRTLVVEGGSTARYLPSGHLVYGRRGTLLAAPFDLDAREMTGPPVPVVDEVMQAGGYLAWSVAEDGSLAYVTNAGDPLAVTLVQVDRSGAEAPWLAPPRRYLMPRLSPNTGRLAVEFGDTAFSDIWVYEAERDTFTRLTSDPARDAAAVWTPDGRRVVFRSERDGGGLFWRAADGADQTTPLMQSNAVPFAFTPDGADLLYVFYNADTGADLGVFNIADRAARPLLRTPFNEANPAVSPDGRWFAYQTNEAGDEQVFVRDLRDVGAGRWRVSANGGTWPVWSADGRELFYVGPGGMMAVSIETDPSVEVGTPELLFDTTPYVVGAGGGGRRFDLIPDEDAFLMLKPAADRNPDAPPPAIVVVLDWLEELGRRVPPS